MISVKKLLYKSVERFTFDSFTESGITIASGDTTSTSIDVSKEGYTPIGIIRINKTGANHANVLLNRFHVASNVAQIGLKNTHSASVTITVGVTVLYQKSAS